MEHVESHTGAVRTWGSASDIRSASPVVRKGDVLYGRLRPYLNKVTNAPFDAYASGEFIVFRPDHAVDARFLRWRLSGQDFVEFAVGLNTGDRPRVTWPQMAPFEIALPPLEEQQRIVTILEDHLSRLHAAIALVGGAEDRAQSVLHAAYREEFARLGADTLKPLPEVARIINGHTPRGVAEVTYAVPRPESVPYWKVGDMNLVDGDLMVQSRTYVNMDDVSRLQLRLAPSGTVVFPKRGGAIATNKKRQLAVEGCFDLNTMGVAPGPALSAPFLLRWFQQVDLRTLADGSNVPQINTPDIARLRMPVPSQEDQEAVVRRLELLKEAIASFPANRLSTQAHSLRRSLLAAAFSGRLTGRECHGHDAKESAVV